MIDFTDLPCRKKTYAGANGSKLCVMYQGVPYMLKFPAAPSRNKAISYANGCISEYLGCHIFELIGIPVQETLLGLYRRCGKEKIVVACRDFTSPGIVLQDFASLKNTIIDSGHNGYGTELSEVLSTIAEQQSVDPVLLTERFWDMFIVDTPYAKTRLSSMLEAKRKEAAEKQDAEAAQAGENEAGKPIE